MHPKSEGAAAEQLRALQRMGRPMWRRRERGCTGPQSDGHLGCPWGSARVSVMCVCVIIQISDEFNPPKQSAVIHPPASQAVGNRRTSKIRSTSGACRLAPYTAMPRSQGPPREWMFLATTRHRIRPPESTHSGALHTPHSM